MYPQPLQKVLICLCAPERNKAAFMYFLKKPLSYVVFADGNRKRLVTPAESH